MLWLTVSALALLSSNAGEARLRTRLSATPQPFAPLPKMMLDIFSASDEIDMIRYRLRLHQPIAYRTIILEANVTHTGQPKPLHVRAALTAAEIARYNVELISVPFTTEEINRTRCSSRKCKLVLEDRQRNFVNTLVASELATLREQPGGRPDVLVHMSDVDELVDVHAVARLHMRGCVTPVLRMYAYGELCPALWPMWAKTVLFNASSGWFERALAANPGLQLRKLTAQCRVLPGFLGWHFSYFLSTMQILNKLQTFSHALG